MRHKLGLLFIMFLLFLIMAASCVAAYASYKTREFSGVAGFGSIVLVGAFGMKVMWDALNE